LYAAWGVILAGGSEVLSPVRAPTRSSGFDP
jgi:hypothetical protein